MGNVVLKISGGETGIADENLEVYRDVSMFAAPNMSGKNGRLHRVAKLVNVKAVQNSIRQIFTWIQGERVLNPEFGSRLRYLLYEQLTPQNQEAVAAEVSHCVSEWEPRADIQRIVNVTDVNAIENNTVHLKVIYTIKGLSDRQFEYSFEYRRPAPSQ